MKGKTDQVVTLQVGMPVGPTFLTFCSRTFLSLAHLLESSHVYAHVSHSIFLTFSLTFLTFSIKFLTFPLTFVSGGLR